LNVNFIVDKIEMDFVVFLEKIKNGSPKPGDLSSGPPGENVT
jgi:hypothetical protein